MMKKLMLVSALIVGLSSVNQTQAVGGTVSRGAIGAAAVGVVAFILVYYYCILEKTDAKNEKPTAVEDEAILKQKS